jgi:C4-dicarboxylate-specific signal transduction histidine kinase
MKNSIFVTALLLAAPVSADEAMQAAIQDYLDTSIRAWAADPVLIDAIQAQNGRTGALTEDEIIALDLAWRAEVGMAERPTIDPVMQNAASDFLRGVVENAGGMITEVFIMDARGLNVAASDVTSDYWQGDEDKHAATYGVGAEAVHMGEIEFDESAQSYQSQVSMTLVDPRSNQPIGAITIGLNADALF